MFPHEVCMISSELTVESYLTDTFRPARVRLQLPQPGGVASQKGKEPYPVAL